MWAIAFMITFVIGGMTGVLFALPPVDFVLHNSLFLIAHFHNVIIGGVLFGAFAGYTYWFPKAFGFKLDERWGKAAFWFWVTGFYVAFMPLYVLGLEGMTRRMQHYDVAEWRPWLVVAAFGALLILCGIGSQIMQLAVSIRGRMALMDRTGDPWDGRTLEWITASPPAAFNFAVLPDVTGEEVYWEVKQRAIARGGARPSPQYQAIEMPHNSPTGFVTAFFAVVTGFAMIWHIWWMAGVGVAGAFATFVVFAWRDQAEYELPAEEVALADTLRREAREALYAGREPGIQAVQVPEKEEPAAIGLRDPRAGFPGPASKRIITGYGFWIFLLSDFVMFSAFYSAYAVLVHATAGGPRPVDLFDERTVAIETACLLHLELRLRLGVGCHLCAKYAVDPGRLRGDGSLRPRLPRHRSKRVRADDRGRRGASSAAPSSPSFFALVGCHGLHVTVGLLWLGTMMAQFFTKGFRPSILRRGLCFSLFWHALDIIWIGIFTNVYLLELAP